MIVIETKDGPQVITRNQIVGYLIAIWFTCVLAAAGVAFFAAGVSSDRSNATLRTVVKLQRQQGHDGLNLIYQNSLSRCTDGAAYRKVIIANTEAQQAFYAFLYARRSQAPALLSNLPTLTTPPPAKPCKQTVEDPNAVGNHIALSSPAKVTG